MIANGRGESVVHESILSGGPQSKDAWIKFVMC
jgi:hypothetical protein